MWFSFIILVVFSLISERTALNVLFVSVGHAGHVIPMFELAKGLTQHNVTFLTQQIARTYVDFHSHTDSNGFHLVYSTDSSNAFDREKRNEQSLTAHAANHSFFDGITYTMTLMSDDFGILLTKTIDLLMNNHYDLIIGNSIIKSINVLSKRAQIPCVIQSTEVLPNMFDFNMPNVHASLTRKHLRQFRYRLFNVIFNVRIMLSLSFRVLPSLYIISKSLPRVPGPFYDSFSFRNLMTTQVECLELFSIPATLYTVTRPYHYRKYLGAFIDRTSIERSTVNELTQWIENKPNRSIIYGAFGTSSLIARQRMTDLIHGLAEFLITNADSYLVLILRQSNYDTYQETFNGLINENYKRILIDQERVRIEHGFVAQKWILQQTSVRIFLSHCGMGSCSEGIFFRKPLICMPFNMDQFTNGMSIDESGIGRSLFVPPSLYQSLIKPHDFHKYTFSLYDVQMKLNDVWTNNTYQDTIDIMSLEMKHAGGIQRAVEEIEFFTRLNGNLDRYAPFHSTLPFYQRYMLDLLFVFILLPMIIVIYVFKVCCRRARKQKKD
jgi:hypothetical protein